MFSVPFPNQISIHIYVLSENSFTSRYTFILMDLFNTLPNDKILDWSKLKAVADDKSNVAEKSRIWFGKDRKHGGKRRKWCLPFITMFSKGFSVGGSLKCFQKSSPEGHLNFRL